MAEETLEHVLRTRRTKKKPFLLLHTDRNTAKSPFILGHSSSSDRQGKYKTPEGEKVLKFFPLGVVEINETLFIHGTGNRKNQREQKKRERKKLFSSVL